jgi:hypothetical protein
MRQPFGRSTGRILLSRRIDHLLRNAWIHRSSVGLPH